jgi:hypothetical protein
MAESRELMEGRRLLAAAEADLSSAEGLARLTEGLDQLDAIMSAGSQADARTARNLASTYASRIYRQVSGLVMNDAQLPEPELEHYFKVVLAFDQIGIALPADAAELKIAVVKSLIERYFEGHSSDRKRAALAELADIDRRR